MKTVGFILGVGLLVSACMPTYTKPYQVKDYSQEQVVALPAQQLVIVSEVEMTQKPPHVEYLMPMSVEKALKNWAFIHLRADNKKSYTAQFVIKSASMRREEEEKPGMFDLNNYKYTLTYEVAVQLVDAKGKVVMSVGTEGFVSRTQPIRSSVQDRDAMMVEMIEEMEKSLNEKLVPAIQQNLVDF